MTDRVDFAQIIRDLEAAGITLYKIATMMHRQFTQVQRWKNGGRVQHHDGVMLLEIHKEYVTIEIGELGDEIGEESAQSVPRETLQM